VTGRALDEVEGDPFTAGRLVGILNAVRRRAIPRSSIASGPAELETHPHFPTRNKTFRSARPSRREPDRGTSVERGAWGDGGARARGAIAIVAALGGRADATVSFSRGGDSTFRSEGDPVPGITGPCTAKMPAERSIVGGMVSAAARGSWPIVAVIVPSSRAAARLIKLTVADGGACGRADPELGRDVTGRQRPESLRFASA